MQAPGLITLGSHAGQESDGTMTAGTDSSTRWPVIAKDVTADHGDWPNLVDYDGARATFRWDQERRALGGLPGGGGVNIAHEAVDRHAKGGRGPTHCGSSAPTAAPARSAT